MAAQGSGQTGTSNATYNLISVAYHALQGAENYDKYAQDAQQDGDQDLAEFFRRVQQQARQAGEEAQQLLASRVQQGTSGGATARQSVGEAMGHAGDKPQPVGE